MRFLLKMAFWLALIAFFLPTPNSDDSADAQVNYLAAFMGAQEALSDMGGFCERAPTACAAGRDIGSFVAARVGDGLAYAYAYAQGHAQTPEPAVAVGPTPASATVAKTQVAPSAAERTFPTGAAPALATDPMETAAVAAEHVRRAAGLPPFDVPAAKTGSPRPAGDLPVSPAIPTPAPRA